MEGDLSLLAEVEKVLPTVAPEKSSFESKSSVTLSLNIIQSCNLACSYCYAEGGDYGKPSRMSFTTALRAVEFFLKSKDEVHIHFFGGEPLLHFKMVKDLVFWAEAQEKKVSFSLTTNGVLLDREKLDFFKRHGVQIKLSYDGKNSQTQYRKLKSGGESAAILQKKLKYYERELKSLEEFSVRGTFMVEKASFVKEFLEEIEGRYKMALAYTLEESKSFSLEEIKKFSSQVKAIFKNFLLRCQKEGSLEKALLVTNLSHLVRVLQSHRPLKRFCAAGKDYFAVSASGDIYFCHRFNEASEGKLGSVLSGFEGHNKLSLDTSSERQEPCRSCWVRNLCQGGCSYEHKDFVHKNPFFCEIQKMEVELALFYIKISALD